MANYAPTLAGPAVVEVLPARSPYGPPHRLVESGSTNMVMKHRLAVEELWSFRGMREPAPEPSSGDVDATRPKPR